METDTPVPPEASDRDTIPYVAESVHESSDEDNIPLSVIKAKIATLTASTSGEPEASTSKPLADPGFGQGGAPEIFSEILPT